jgi:hypothetical protein
MTTARSPLRALRAQAKTVAATLKAAERGQPLGTKHDEKVVAARANETVTFAVVMDDKILKIEMAWTKIRETSEAGIAEYVLNQMREARDAVQ